jgi:hypothetical protein
MIQLIKFAVSNSLMWLTWAAAEVREVAAAAAEVTTAAAVEAGTGTEEVPAATGIIHREEGEEEATTAATLGGIPRGITSPATIGAVVKARDTTRGATGEVLMTISVADTNRITVVAPCATTTNRTDQHLTVSN